MGTLTVSHPASVLNTICLTRTAQSRRTAGASVVSGFASAAEGALLFIQLTANAVLIKAMEAHTRGMEKLGMPIRYHSLHVYTNLFLRFDRRFRVYEISEFGETITTYKRTEKDEVLDRMVLAGRDAPSPYEGTR